MKMRKFAGFMLAGTMLLSTLSGVRLHHRGPGGKRRG